MRDREDVRIVEPRATGSTAFLLLETAGQWFALFLQDIIEISPMVPLTEAPGMPQFVVGWLDSGSGANTPPPPVLRLDALLGLPHPARVPGLHTPIVLIRSGKRAEGTPAVLGLLVERVHQILRVAPDRVLPADPQETFNGCVVGLLSLPEGLTASILAVERLLLIEEQERLQAYARVREERRRALVAAGNEAAPA